MVCDLWVFINEQLMLLQISPTLMCRYDKAFGAAELSTPKSSAVGASKWKKKKKSLRCHSGINQIFTRQMFSLSVCDAFLTALQCSLFFIVSNSQRGFAVGQGGEGAGMMKEVLFISSDSLGFVWKHQTFFFIYIYI